MQFNIIDAIAGQAVHIVIIPKLSIELHESIPAHFAICEKVLILILFKITFINIDCKDNSWGCDNWWSIFEELGIVTLEFANLEGHIIDSLI